MKGGLLTEKQAAEYLGFSARWLRDRRLDGTGPEYIRIPGSKQVRYTLGALNDWISKIEREGEK